MIIEEYPHNGRTDRIRHYSDLQMKIKQVETGILYDEAIDVIPCRYTYEEIDIPIENEAPLYTESSLSVMSNAELSEICSSYGFTGSMNRTVMIYLILHAQEENA